MTNHDLDTATPFATVRLGQPTLLTRDGPGWRADVDLPYGVTVSDVLDRRERLASGLRRPLGCVWPEPAHDAHAGRLILWVGDTDLSKAPAAPWPLASRGLADVFAPLPFGTDPRGRTVSIPLPENNVLVGSLPGAGKTSAVRVLLLGATAISSAIHGRTGGTSRFAWPTSLQPARP